MEVVYIDEREDVQKKTFAKWINSQLLKHQHDPIADLFLDLRDGNRLLSLLEVLTSNSYKRERGRMRVHHLNNVNKALQILEQNNVKLVNISSNDIVDGNPKLTLGLVWSIILHWQVHYHLKDLMTELQQTNLEKTLLAWCRQTVQNYEGVDIKNFTTSWSDGLAFNALLHRWKPHLFDFSAIARKHPNARLDHAFRLAQEQLGIERLLDPEDVNTSVPDKKSILMYVTCLFQSLPHSGQDIEGIDISAASDSGSTVTTPATTPGIEQPTVSFPSFPLFEPPVSRPLSLATNVSVELGGYQVALEEVLTWLLEAEDVLSNAPEPGDSLEVLKRQFKEHEAFLSELSGHQDGVGAVLEEGERLLAEGGLQVDEELEVHVQMSLLNSRWENLRKSSLDRENKIHQTLMEMQQTQLEALRQWLTKTEDRISRMAGAENKSPLDEQLKQLNELQEDIKNQQAVVDGLKNMVVVVDEENSETVYAQMEDQLSALGERWTHICQWQQKRWQNLQALSTKWSDLQDDYKKLMSWLNETEITLKQMEAAPATEIGHILDRIKKLQLLKMEMNMIQKKLAALQKTIQDIEGHGSNSECMNMLEKLENLEDRLEAVNQIMEVQGQRITNSGFEVDLTYPQLPTNPAVDWINESIIGNAQKEELAGMSPSHSDSKKRRIDTVARQEFETALLNLYKWLDYIDLEISRSEGVFNELTVDEKKIVYEDNLSDVEAHKEEYEKVLQLGKRLIEELEQINERHDDEDAKLKNLESCWSNTHMRLKEIKEKIDLLTKIKECKVEVTSLRLMLDGHSKWFELNHETSQVELLRVKVKSMKSYEDRVKKLTDHVEDLKNQDIIVDELNTLKNDYEKFISDWKALSKKLSDRANELSNAADKTPPKKFNETLDILMFTVNNIESVLESEHALISDEDTMKKRIEKFKDIQETLETHQKSFDYVNKVGQDLIAKTDDEAQASKIKDQLQDLNTKWSEIPIIIEERLQKLTKDIETLKTFNTELDSLEDWLDRSALQLIEISEDCTIKDVETTEFKLKQVRELIEEVNKTKPRIENLQTMTNTMLENSEPNFSSVLNGKLENISYKWNSIVDGAKSQGDEYESALKKNDETVNGIEDFTNWLKNLESEIPVEGKVTSSVELFQVRGRYQSLKDKVDRRVEEFRNLNELGSDKLLSTEGSTVQDLGRRFTFLNSRWSDVTDRIFERYKHFQNASHEYGEFRALVAQESDWLDKLEKRLKKSSKNAADAEDISEELDDLENYIRNHPDSRFEKLQEIGKQLVDDDIMTQSIQTDVESLINRWENLNKQAGERAKLLEGSVKQAQQSEGRILALQNSLTQVDSVLTARLDCDLTADDLPHDYQKLVEEMDSQLLTLDEMSAQVESYKAAGKQEAAQRLQEQMGLIRQKFAEVQTKFQRFRSPANIEPRLSRAMRELRGIEEATCLLELATEDPDAIERQYNHCLRFYQTLSEIKGEIESIIVAGRKLVEEGSVSEPDEFSKRIDTLKDLYNKLGQQIAESKAILESALELSRDMYKQMSYINMSIESINKELDTQRHRPDLPVNAIYVTETLTEVIPRLNAVKDKLFKTQDEFSKLCDPTYLEQLKEKLSNIIDRLANTEKRLRTCNGSEDEPNVNEIYAWLSGMEDKLNKLDDIPVKQLNDNHLYQCKVLQAELMESKPKILQLQRFSYYSKVAEVCNRWEEISKRIQDWIHKITNNVLVSSKGRDNRRSENSPNTLNNNSQSSINDASNDVNANRTPSSDSKNSGLTSAKTTPESAPITNVSMRSHKSSAKAADNTRIIDVSRTVRRRLNMSTYPEVEQISQENKEDENEDAPFAINDVDKEEFYLSKNSKLFSQVSTNTLQTSPPGETVSGEQTDCQVVEVKALEIVKAVAATSADDRVVLPKANFGVQQVPQVVERVEIVEVSESESIDTDPEEKESYQDTNSAYVDSPMPKKELVSILKRSNSTVESPSQKDLADLLDEALEQSPSTYLKKAKLPMVTSTPEITKTRIDTQSVAEYLILDEGNAPKDPPSQAWSIAEPRVETSPTRKKANGKEVTFARNMDKESPVPKRTKVQQLSSGQVVREDCDSFYGSDKEVDEPVIFSDDTEIEVGSSSSEESDLNGKQGNGVLDKMKIEKVHQRVSSSAAERPTFADKKSPFKTGRVSRAALEREIREFEDSAQQMLNRMDIMLMTVGGVTNEKDPCRRLEILKSEISGLAPDAATLISRGDGLVMTVHSNDPSRAEKIKQEHQDKLRSKWHQVMQECETKRAQALKAEDILRNYNQLISELENWFRVAPNKLEQANNYEGQLESFTVEFDARQDQVKKITQYTQELKKMNIGHNENAFYSINSRWQELSSQFKRFSGSKDKDKQHTDKKVEMPSGGITVPDFVTRTSKLREAISTLYKSLNATPLNGKDFENLTEQDDCLKKISSALNILKPSVEEMQYLWDNMTDNEPVRHVYDQLKKEWTQANQCYIEKYNRWAKCNEKLNELRNTCWNFDDSLLKMEVMLKEMATNPQSKSNKSKMLELDHEMPRMLRTMNGISATITDVTNRSSPGDVKDWQQVIQDLKARWQSFVTEWNSQKSRSGAMGKQRTPKQILDGASNLVSQVNSLLVSTANPSDDTSLSIRLSMVKAREKELADQIKELQILKNQKLPEVSDEECNKLIVNLEKAHGGISSHKEYVESKLTSLKKYVQSLDSVMGWVSETRSKLNVARELPQPDRTKTTEEIMVKVEDRQMEVKDVLENYTNLEKECESAKQTVSIELQEKLKKLRDDWNLLKNRGDIEVESSSTVVQAQQKERERNVGAAAAAASSSAGGEPVASASASPGSESTSPSSPLDRQLLQIRDWLAGKEDMIRQQVVVVGDVEDILQLIDKQKTVLRELEQKKPQLDELVHTAENLRADTNRQQLHGKVTKLREHWDETNSKVMQRKSQLDAMLADSQRFETKRQEVEIWLSRMEQRLERMRTVGHTADVLEAQLREQKSFHAELHQYKHQIELFNSLTQKLIAVYQQDDTTRVKKLTETINQRYNNLNSSIINRGKLLHSAMNSLHNFDRSLDKFLAWLSEAESSTETLDAEADRLSGRRDQQTAITRSQLQLKQHR